MTYPTANLLLPALVLSVLCSCSDNRRPPSTEQPAEVDYYTVVDASADPSKISPLPPWPQSLNSDSVALGERLFYDRRLSADGSLSCASCHPPQRGGVDGQRRAVGINRSLLPFNTPTVLNSGWNRYQFWDGRMTSLEQQVAEPITDAKVMASTWPRIINTLNQDEQMRERFEHLYSDGVTIDTITKSLANYLRSLSTPNAPFDRYLNGDQNAISQRAKRGYRLFQRYGCVSCHNGVNIGGQMLQKLGIAEDYFSNRKTITKADLGHFNITGKEKDKHTFRVPSLRNIALTAPYLHDGSINTLEQMVVLMSRYQLGNNPSKEDVESIVALLHTFTGQLPQSTGD